MKLFELTTNTRLKFGRTLIQIRAVVDFKTVKAGDLGGWVEDEKSISEDCWVYPNGEVFKHARLHGGVMHGGEMRGGEMRGGVMHGGVMWGGVMHGGEMRGGEMRGGVMHGGVMRGGEMWGGEMHGGEMRRGVMRGGVMQGGVMHGGVMRGGEMWGGVMRGGVMQGGVMRGGVMHKDNHIGFANVGSENGYLLAYIDDHKIMISRGCFHGTIDEFYSAVERTHGDNKYAEFYKSLRSIIEMKLEKFTEKSEGDHGC